MKKLDDQWAGPFPVIEKVGAAAYRIKLPGQHRRRHPVFNQDLLLPFKPSVYPQQQSPPPPDPTLIDNEEEWEVDFIKDSRWTNRLRRSVQYLVHWKVSTTMKTLGSLLVTWYTLRMPSRNSTRSTLINPASFKALLRCGNRNLRGG